MLEESMTNIENLDEKRPLKEIDFFSANTTKF